MWCMSFAVCYKQGQDYEKFKSDLFGDVMNLALTFLHSLGLIQISAPVMSLGDWQLRQASPMFPRSAFESFFEVRISEKPITSETKAHWMFCTSRHRWSWSSVCLEMHWTHKIGLFVPCHVFKSKWELILEQDVMYEKEEFLFSIFTVTDVCHALPTLQDLTRVDFIIQKCWGGV